MSKKAKEVEKEVENEEVQTEAINDQEKSADNSNEQDEASEEQEDPQVAYDELNDRYLRLYSEFDNFRKRTQKEKLELYKNAGEDVIMSVLPVLDDLDRALLSMDDKAEIKTVKEGISLIHQKIKTALTQQGLKPIESAVGKEFDVNLHEAVSRIPAPEKKLKGKVIDEVEKGYLLNDKVIRFTKVVIGE